MRIWFLSFHLVPSEKIVSGSVSLTDEIEIYSPVATTIELPFEASASLVAVQTFCNPDNSIAEAKATVTATLGTKSATAQGHAYVLGGFLDTDYPSEKQVVTLDVPKGVSKHAVSITGSLYTRSKVQGLSPLDVITCGSNAGAIAGNSFDCKIHHGPQRHPFTDRHLNYRFKYRDKLRKPATWRPL